MSVLEVPPAYPCVVATTLSTEFAKFQMLGFSAADGVDHVALVLGEVSDPQHPPLVRVHSECLTGDALGSWRCDCGEQLRAAMREIGHAGRGIIVYLRGHEGRGIGLIAKLRAYALQDTGLDTVDANVQLGFPPDARRYEAAAGILQSLGVTRIRLLSSNPDKVVQLSHLGIEVVARHPLPVLDRPDNAFYLNTKRRRMGHDSVPSMAADVWSELCAGRLPSTAYGPVEAELLDQYGPLVAAGKTVTIAQLAQSVDGFIATRTGNASYVSGPADRLHLHRLRALVDAVVVGAATVLADDPQLTVRDVDGASPVRVILDPRARVPADCRVMDDGVTPTLWVVGQGVTIREVKPHVEVLHLPVGAGGFAPAQVLAALRARGLGRVLVEGGGRLVSAFLAAGQLDRLYLTTAPVLIGDGVPGLRFAGADHMRDALRAPVRRHLLGEDTCSEFDLAALRRT
jgi:GTP cyclohydrolase II